MPVKKNVLEKKKKTVRAIFFLLPDKTRLKAQFTMGALS